MCTGLSSKTNNSHLQEFTGPAYKWPSQLGLLAQLWFPQRRRGKRFIGPSPTPENPAISTQLCPNCSRPQSLGSQGGPCNPCTSPRVERAISTKKYKDVSSACRCVMRKIKAGWQVTFSVYVGQLIAELNQNFSAKFNVCSMISFQVTWSHGSMLLTGAEDWRLVCGYSNKSCNARLW